jgi:hypothetical protein
MSNPRGVNQYTKGGTGKPFSSKGGRSLAQNLTRQKGIPMSQRHANRHWAQRDTSGHSIPVIGLPRVHKAMKVFANAQSRIRGRA